jgi:hypothetical protein
LTLSDLLRIGGGAEISAEGSELKDESVEGWKDESVEG